MRLLRKAKFTLHIEVLNNLHSVTQMLDSIRLEFYNLVSSNIGFTQLLRPELDTSFYLLFLSHPTSNLTGSLFDSFFKIYPKSYCFPPPLLPLL